MNEIEEFIKQNKLKNDSDGFKDYHYKIKDLVNDGKIEDLKLLLELSSKAELNHSRLRSILIMVGDLSEFLELPQEPIKLMKDRLQSMINKPLY